MQDFLHTSFLEILGLILLHAIYLYISSLDSSPGLGGGVGCREAIWFQTVPGCVFVSDSKGPGSFVSFK